MKSSCTPCSGSVSFSGHLVALIRLRKSVRSASGTFTLNGRSAVLSFAIWFLLRLKSRVDRGVRDRAQIGADAEVVEGALVRASERVISTAGGPRRLSIPVLYRAPHLARATDWPRAR